MFTVSELNPLHSMHEKINLLILPNWAPEYFHSPMSLWAKFTSLNASLASWPASLTTHSLYLDWYPPGSQCWKSPPGEHPGVHAHGFQCICHRHPSSTIQHKKHGYQSPQTFWHHNQHDWFNCQGPQGILAAQVAWLPGPQASWQHHLGRKQACYVWQASQGRCHPHQQHQECQQSLQQSKHVWQASQSAAAIHVSRVTSDLNMSGRHHRAAAIHVSRASSNLNMSGRHHRAVAFHIRSVSRVSSNLNTSGSHYRAAAIP